MTVQEYIKADRAWPRYLRVPHAKMQLAKASSDKEKGFWRAVLDANGHHPAPRPPHLRVP